MTTALIKPQWSPLTIALTVLGFLVFWPLGLAMLAYILWGEIFGSSGVDVDRFVRRSRNWARGVGAMGSGRHGRTSGNAAFDAYRQEQLQRLEEERKRLDEEVDAFHEYMRNLRMARDREEFDRFMRERQTSRQGWTTSSGTHQTGGATDL